MIEVAHEGLGHPHLSFRGELHQVDAAARRVHLFAPERVGGACGQAEAAVHAVSDELLRGRVVLVEDAGLATWFREGWRSHQIPPTNRPGLRMPTGSSSSLR